MNKDELVKKICEVYAENTGMMFPEVDAERAVYVLMPDPSKESNAARLAALAESAKREMDSLNGAAMLTKASIEYYHAQMASTNKHLACLKKLGETIGERKRLRVKERMKRKRLKAIAEKSKKRNRKK